MNNNFNIFFLVNQYVLNKGKFPRNRQQFKTGVFWSIALSIISVFGFQLFFYGSTLNFSYIWILYISCIAVSVFINFLKIIFYVRSCYILFFNSLLIIISSLIKNFK